MKPTTARRAGLDRAPHEAQNHGARIAPEMTSVPIARYRFTARAQQPLPLPEYAGSLLRGQFGAALRHVACMTRQPTCPGCPLVQTCPYTRIFAAPPPPKGSHALQDFSQIPNPYIIEPPTPGARLLAAGDVLVFQVVLVGHAIDQLALIIFAMQLALAQGLTRQRVPCELLQVQHICALGQATPVWTAAQPTLLAHPASITHPDTPCEFANGDLHGAHSHSVGRLKSALPSPRPGVTLHIHTPLRLQSQGHPLGVGQLTPRALVAAVARRAALLMEFHAQQTGWGDAAKRITHLAEQLTDSQALHWFDWTRYSSRQQQEMTLGGVLGHWTLHGTPDLLAEITPWLWLGQWLHVGKNASMGLGCYTLESC